MSELGVLQEISYHLSWIRGAVVLIAAYVIGNLLGRLCK